MDPNPKEEPRPSGDDGTRDRLSRMERMRKLYRDRARDARDNGEERKAKSLELAAKRCTHEIERLERLLAPA